MTDHSPPLIAIAGNPNSGKTTLFNILTQSGAKVGNYPGVTIEKHTATAQIDDLGIVDVVDIPGSYSVLARTGEEQIAVEALLGLRDSPRPDAVVVCVDATQLLRGLYLVMQILELGANVVVALTMVDEAGDAAPSSSLLSEKLQCPVIPVVAPRRQGIESLRHAISLAVQGGEDTAKWHWHPSEPLQLAIERVRAHLPEAWPNQDAIALWALMSIDIGDELIGVPNALRQSVVAEQLDGCDVDNEVVCARYRWLDTYIAPLQTKRVDRSRTEKVDRILIHRVAGFAVFLAIMFLLFQSLFAWADPAIHIIETSFAWISSTLERVLPRGVLADFLIHGVIAGVGSVVVFLPQILLLFFFIGIMEDSGYMARVAYLMDRIMKSMNLHGRAFVPMMSGFACAVPAVLATRTLERRRDRLLTMLVVPLMTCSARLPIYTLVIAALFPASHVLGIFPVQGLLMVFMYLFSVLIALIAAWVLSRTLKPLRAKRLPFVIELPPYRRPRLRDVIGMMWQRTSVFLKEAGSVILVCTIVLWALVSFPRHIENPTKDYDTLIAGASSTQVAQSLQRERQGELLRNSYGGRIGRIIEPAIEPLGFDWKIGVGIIGAFAAREVFISTMGVVYSVGQGVDETSATLRQHIRSETRDDGRPVYTPLVGLSLMIFFALACQCMSTLAVVRRETKSYRWPIFLFGYMTVLAWFASFIVYQGGRLFGF